ncbi:MAG: prepilin-type N-terminal cleavage/methylation domain-containing protein [Pseudomonadota bacterium]
MLNIRNIIKKSDFGFTLVELLVAMAVSTIVMTAICSLNVAAKKLNAAQSDIAWSQMEAWVTLDLMGREIRMAGYFPEAYRTGKITSSPLSLPKPARIEEATATTFAFQGDIDNNLKEIKNELKEQVEAVRYSFEGNANDKILYRQVWRWDEDKVKWESSSANPVLYNIVDGGFAYKDAENKPLEGPPKTLEIPRSDIRSVEVWIRVRSERPDPQYYNKDTVKVSSKISGLQDLPAGQERYRTFLAQSRFYLPNMAMKGPYE